jgi:hypothetical protein
MHHITIADFIVLALTFAGGIHFLWRERQDAKERGEQLAGDELDSSELGPETDAGDEPEGHQATGIDVLELELAADLGPFEPDDLAKGRVLH